MYLCPGALRGLRGGGCERLIEVCFKLKSFCDREKIARNLLAPCTLYGLVFVPVCILGLFVNMQFIFFAKQQPQWLWVFFYAVLWIRIGPNHPHHFAGSGSDRLPGHADLDPGNPDRCQCQAYEKVETFFRKCSICCPKYLKF